MGQVTAAELHFQKRYLQFFLHAARHIEEGDTDCKISRRPIGADASRDGVQESYPFPTGSETYDPTQGVLNDASQTNNSVLRLQRRKRA